MKVTKIGKGRYALIVMAFERKTHENVNDAVTYFNSDNLHIISNTYYTLLKVEIDKPYYYDMQIFDYEKARYIDLLYI